MKTPVLFTSDLRFAAKVSIHPSQVPLINKYFDKEKLITFAKNVVCTFSEIGDGSAVIVKDDQMMDTPSLKLYKKYFE